MSFGKSHVTLSIQVGVTCQVGHSFLVKKKNKNNSVITRAANAQNASIKEVIVLSVRAVLLLGRGCIVS